jgi:hypothetical protein
MSKDRRKRTKRLIHGHAVRKHIENVRIDDHDVRTLRISGCSDPAHGPGEVVLRAKGIAVCRPPFSANVLLHISSALVEWPVVQK